MRDEKAYFLKTREYTTHGPNLKHFWGETFAGLFQRSMSVTRGIIQSISQRS